MVDEETKKLLADRAPGGLRHPRGEPRRPRRPRARAARQGDARQGRGRRDLRAAAPPARAARRGPARPTATRRRSRRSRSPQEIRDRVAANGDRPAERGRGRRRSLTPPGAGGDVHGDPGLGPAGPPPEPPPDYAMTDPIGPTPRPTTSRRSTTPRAEAAVRELLIAIGEDPDREGLRDTPARVARAYAELTAGLRMSAEDVLTTTFDIGHDEMVLVRDIELWSMCEHHLVPFTGVAHVGYIPAESGKITGLSKLARLVDVYAKRPQVQERLTTQVADALMEILEAARRDRRDRGRAPLHDDARGPQGRRQHDHLRGARHHARARRPAPRRWPDPRGRCRGTRSSVRSDRPRLMGVVNVTPDSFSDGGRWRRRRGRDRPRPRAARRGRRHPRRRRRVDPAGRDPAAASTRSSTAWSRSSRALAADGCGRLRRHDARRGRRGARSRPAPRSSTTSPAGWPTPTILDVVAALEATYVAMHWRGARRPDAGARRRTTSRAAWSRRSSRELGERVEAALAAGDRADDRIVLDPGLGLRQDRRAQLGAAARARRSCTALGFPLLVGASRKSFLGSLLADAGRHAAAGRRAGGRQHRAHRAARRSRGCGASGCTTYAPARTPSRVPRRDCEQGGATDERRRAGRSTRHRVLRPPRRLRLRAARRPDLRDRPRARPRHRAGGGLATTCGTPSTTEVSWPR